jgi:hypothetical protein
VSLDDGKQICEICGIETEDYVGKFTAAGLKYFCKSCYAKHERGEI